MYFYTPAGGFTNESGAESDPGPDPEPSPSISRRPAAPERPSGVALDIQGTLLDPAGLPLPGSVKALSGLAADGTPFVLASNQTAMSSAALAADLREKGFAVDEDDVLTTASMTEDLLRGRYPGARVAFFGDSVPFDRAGIELVESRADVVVLAGAGSWLDHDALNAALRQVRAGADLVAMHSNLCWQRDDGLALDIGALLPGIEAATGTQARVVGKPSPNFFQCALARKGIAPQGALMVGDDIEADVLAAQRLGMTGVLVRTGKYRGDRVGGVGDEPRHVIDSIADLPNLLEGGDAE